MNSEFAYSIVATVYNDETQIISLLQNIENQSIKPKEIVIVDGGSTDKTCNLIMQYNNQIKLIRNGRLNISQGLNIGIKNTSNSWIGIVATGNKYEDTYFEKLIKKIQEEENTYVAAYGSIKGDMSTLFGEIYNETFIQDDFGMPTNRGVLIKKAVFDIDGYFYEKFVYAGEDAEFYRRLKKKGRKFAYIADANLYWSTPLKLKDYYCQERRYNIGHMQIHNNKIIFKTMWKSLVYFVFILLMFMACFFPVTRYLGCFMFCAFLLYNLHKIRIKGFKYCIGINIKAFIQTICLCINRKYLLNRNKIEKEYLIDQLIN